MTSTLLNECNDLLSNYMYSVQQVLNPGFDIAVTVTFLAMYNYWPLYRKVFVSVKHITTFSIDAWKFVGMKTADTVSTCSLGAHSAAFPVGPQNTFSESWQQEACQWLSYHRCRIELANACNVADRCRGSERFAEYLLWTDQCRFGPQKSGNTTACSAPWGLGSGCTSQCSRCNPKHLLSAKGAKGC